MELAARENAISPSKLTDLQIILFHLMLNARANESSRLAYHVQESLNDSLNRGKSSHRDRGIKQAPFIVLMGARMPAILAEISFISNRAEERRLKNRMTDGNHGQRRNHESRGERPKENPVD